MERGMGPARASAPLCQQCWKPACCFSFCPSSTPGRWQQLPLPVTAAPPALPPALGPKAELWPLSVLPAGPWLTLKKAFPLLSLLSDPASAPASVGWEPCTVGLEVSQEDVLSRAYRHGAVAWGHHRTLLQGRRSQTVRVKLWQRTCL